MNTSRLPRPVLSGGPATSLALLLASFVLLEVPWGPGTVLADEPAEVVCEVPTAFEAPPREEFRRTRNTFLRGTYGTPRHRAQDVVVAVGEPQRIVGKFAYGGIDKDMKGEDVLIHAQPHGPCGPWVELGRARTTKDGERGVLWGYRDDGGRVFFEVPGDRRLPQGRHRIRLTVPADGSHAELFLWVVPEGTPTVVFDLDGTLTTGDIEIVREFVAGAAGRDYVPRARKGGRETAWRWADEGYLVLYLSGRPDVLLASSRAWLALRGFPPGPVRVTDRNRDAIPCDSGVRDFKLRALRAFAGAGAGKTAARLVAAYGNAPTDISAYARAGVPKAKTYIVGEHAGDKKTRAVETYVTHLKRVPAPPPAVPAAPRALRW